MSGSTLKKLAAVTALLIVLWVLYLYRQVPRPGAPFAKAYDAVHIVYTQGSQKVDLTKEKDGWRVLLSTGPAPAEGDFVRGLIGSLRNIQVEEVIASGADRAGVFDLNDSSVTHISLWDASGKIVAEGLFGKQAADYNHIYFQYPGKPDVYLAAGIHHRELGKPDPYYWQRQSPPPAAPTK